MIAAVLLSCVLTPQAASNEPQWYGARSEALITPEVPIRLSGYAARGTEANFVKQPLWVRALSLRHAGVNQPTLLWITVDAIAISRDIVERCVGELGLPREDVVISVTHSHTAPCIDGTIPNLFAADLPSDQAERIRRYTELVEKKIVEVGFNAAMWQEPARVFFAQGEVGFAINRRTKGGPVDHSLPCLIVTSDETSEVVGVVSNYACHCTTFGADMNEVAGDWAGWASFRLENRTSLGNCTALTMIGCGGDQNPSPAGTFQADDQNSLAYADEVERLALSPTRREITAAPIARFERIALDFQTPPTRAEFEERAKQSGIVGYHAKKQLSKLDRGALATTLEYPVQSFVFGDQLAMVFLGGEVVVDYSKRLKWEYDAAKLWISAYSNDVPCYIPSRRVLAEGGCEADSSLLYYDKPAKLAPTTEDRIVAAVERQLPDSLRTANALAETPRPKSARDSLGDFDVRDDLSVELAASEPLIESPVAIDWTNDGKLLVCEMRDYPTGMDLAWKKGGRVVLLEDRDGDGVFDRSTVFLDDLVLPTGVTAWRDGVLICAAPDILFARDTNGDGRADEVTKLFSGFYVDNQQARVNSISLGLDNWFYGASGLFGGEIEKPGGAKVPISGRDFRMALDFSSIEPAAGLSQQGRVRDDFGNWFGCDNSTLAWHFPLAERDAARNPSAILPDSRVAVANDEDPNRLFPISRTLTRFNDPGSAGRTTSACGLEVYRDDWLGKEFAGDLFTCEPVHDLVHRLHLEANGATFSAHRADGEEEREFLASKDNWFRPVQVRTGPDGALYVVDMHRLVIEHPRWIPSETLAHLDVRAGADTGRIWRVVRKGAARRAVPNVATATPIELAQALDSPNGRVRDLAHAELLARNDASAVPTLVKLAAEAERPASRVQALCVLDALGLLDAKFVRRALADPDEHVRANAVRLAERFATSRELDADVFARVDDESPIVRFQLALSLGEWREPKACDTLAALAAANVDDTWIAAAIETSIGHCSLALLRALAASPAIDAIDPDWFRRLVLAALVDGSREDFATLAGIFAPSADETQIEPWRRLAATGWFEALDRSKLDRTTRTAIANSLDAPALFDAARGLALDDESELEPRRAALELIGRAAEHFDQDLELLFELCTPSHSPEIQSAALERLGAIDSERVADGLIAHADGFAPSLRARVPALLESRAVWTARFVDALEKNEFPVNSLSTLDRNTLVDSKDSGVRDRIRALFAARPKSSRAEVVAKFRSAIDLAGDSGAGAKLFDANCATCHQLRGRGVAVGPDLRTQRAKSKDAILLSILDPNAAIDNRYVAYTVETRDGRIQSGVIGAETANAVTLVQSGGQATTVPRSEIETLRSTGLSLMPEGLEAKLTPQDLADLIAFVASAPREFGSANPDEIAAAKLAYSARGADGFDAFVETRESLDYPSWLGRQRLHYCRQSDGAWKLAWNTRPIAMAEPTAKVALRCAVAMGFASQPSAGFTLSVDGAESLDFDVALDDASWRSADGKLAASYHVFEADAEDSNGVLELEFDPSLVHAGRPVRIEVLAHRANSERWFGVYDVKP